MKFTSEARKTRSLPRIREPHLEFSVDSSPHMTAQSFRVLEGVTAPVHGTSTAPSRLSNNDPPSDLRNAIPFRPVASLYDATAQEG